MIDATLQWDGDKVTEVVLAAGYESVVRATVYLWTQITQELNVSNPRPYLTPSQPDEPPRKRTGWLQRHVQYRLDEAKRQGIVGVAAQAPYGIFLDQGTRNMRARPFMRATVLKYWTQLQAIAQGG